MEGDEESAYDADYEALVARLAAEHSLRESRAVEGSEESGPERPYSGENEVVERESSQTDELNARLLAAFDRLLDSGSFKLPAQPSDSPDWDDQ